MARRLWSTENSASVRQTCTGCREERRLFTVHTRNRGNVDPLAFRRGYHVQINNVCSLNPFASISISAIRRLVLTLYPQREIYTETVLQFFLQYFLKFSLIIL